MTFEEVVHEWALMADKYHPRFDHGTLVESLPEGIDAVLHDNHHAISWAQ